MMAMNELREVTNQQWHAPRMQGVLARVRPGQGDAVGKYVYQGTAFTDLPGHWTCPNCAASKDAFLVLSDD